MKGHLIDYAQTIFDWNKMKLQIRCCHTLLEKMFQVPYYNNNSLVEMLLRNHWNLSRTFVE